MKFTNGSLGYLPLKNVLAKTSFETIVMETLVLNKTRNDHTRILVVTDLFTKCTLLYSTHSHSASETADILLATYSLFGIPKTVYTDQGVEFNNNLTSFINESFFIKHSFSLVGSHCHQAQSSVKIVLNSTLKTLSQAIEENRDVEWDDLLDQIQYTINTRTDTQKWELTILITFRKKSIFQRK